MGRGESSHACFDASGVATFCNGNHVIQHVRVTRFPICGRTLASAEDITRVPGDPDLVFVIIRSSDPSGMQSSYWCDLTIYGKSIYRTTTLRNHCDFLYTHQLQGWFFLAVFLRVAGLASTWIGWFMTSCWS